MIWTDPCITDLFLFIYPFLISKYLLYICYRIQSDVLMLDIFPWLFHLLNVSEEISYVFWILFLIPIVYKSFFLTYGIEMLYFICSPYIIGEFIGISLLVFWAEYYWFVKNRLEIKHNSWLKDNKVSSIVYWIAYCLIKKRLANSA